MFEKQIRSPGHSCETVASFLIKTYQILDHLEFDHLICWERDGVGFVVKDVVAFTRQILPKYFRHGNFSSFVRQLNMYDFHKIKQQNDTLVFKNPLFRKGEQSQLKDIKRKASKKIFSNSIIHSERSNLGNQKYCSTMKTLKKQIQSQINQSSLSLDKSLVVFKESSDSNQRKKKYIEDINLQSEQINLQALFSLKQQCFKYFDKLDVWLTQGLVTQNKKQQLVANCISELQKAKQNPNKSVIPAASEQNHQIDHPKNLSVYNIND